MSAISPPSPDASSATGISVPRLVCSLQLCEQLANDLMLLIEIAYGLSSIKGKRNLHSIDNVCKYCGACHRCISYVVSYVQLRIYMYK